MKIELKNEMLNELKCHRNFVGDAIKSVQDVLKVSGNSLPEQARTDLRLAIETLEDELIATLNKISALKR